MRNKGRKLLALFMVLAMIATYSFSVSIMSVYADDEPGDVSAKATASEDATPATSDPKPQAGSETPAPSDSGDQGEPTGNDAGTTGTDPGNTGNDGSGNDSGSGTIGDNEAVNGTDDPDAVTEGEVATGELIEGVVDEEEEEESGYPEVTLHANAGGVSVTLYAPEGALPEGAKLSASMVNSQTIFNAVAQRVETEETEMVDAVAIDVTPLDKDGHAVQPKKTVTVTFNGTGLEDGNINVFRVSDSGSSVTQMGTSIASPDKQQFSTDHFTIYVASSTAADPNGDGSGEANSITHRYVLENGESVDLVSDQPAWYGSNWNVVQSVDGVSLTGQTVRNEYQGSGEQTFIVHHAYINDWWSFIYQNWSHEYFYITIMPQKLTVTFMLQDAGDSDFSQYGDSIEVYKGGSPSEDDMPSMNPAKTIDGVTYSFYGWYSDEGCQTDAVFDNIEEDLVVYGKYTTEATLHYEANTDASATVPEDQVAGAGNSVTIGNATCEGYGLVEWNTKADGNGGSYQPGDTVKMPAKGLTLYAIWDESITINYYRNYNNFDQSIWTSRTAPINAQTNIVSETPTRGGGIYIFRGWATSRGGAPAYYPGSTYTTGETDVNLYAIWANISINQLTALTANSGTFTYDGQEHSVSGVTGGTPWSEDPNYVKVGDTALFGFDIYAYVANINATGTDAGKYSTPISAPLYYYYFNFLTWKWEMGRITDNPYMSIKAGTLTIKPAEITISTKSDTKEYDGTALTAGGEASFTEGEERKTSEITPEGGPVTLINGETLYMKAAGSQTEVGKSDNPCEFNWSNSESTAKKYNYRFVEGGIGELEVTKKEEPTPTPTPTPTPDNPGDDGAAAAANIAAAADDLTAEIGDNDTPEASAINDNAAPKSAPTKAWALLNLIAAILTIIGAALAAFRKNSATTVVKGVGLASAAAAVIVFLVTQDLSAPMQIVDGWTVLMAALFGVQCVTTGMTMKTPQVDD